MTTGAPPAKPAATTLKNSIVPLMVLLLIMLLLEVTFVVLHILPLLQSRRAAERRQGMVEGIVTHSFFGLTFFCLLMACCVSPGHVAVSEPWDDSAVGKETRLDGRRRRCRRCDCFKPDRAHHCRVCGACVLEMDHHCPWIRSCVGYHNHKYFFLLLFYGAVSLLTFDVFMFPRFLAACRAISSFNADFVVMFAWFTAVLVTALLVPFLLLHCWLLTNAFTTIEYCEKRRSKRKHLAKGRPLSELHQTSMYDLGMYRNIKAWLGPYPLLWLVPVRVGMGGPNAGYSFEHNPEHALLREEDEEATPAEDPEKQPLKADVGATVVVVEQASPGVAAAKP